MSQHVVVREEEGIERLFENLPVEIRVDRQARVPETVIGWAHAYQTTDGESHIHITLHEEGSRRLGSSRDVQAVLTLVHGVRRPDGG